MPSFLPTFLPPWQHVIGTTADEPLRVNIPVAADSTHGCGAQELTIISTVGCVHACLSCQAMPVVVVALWRKKARKHRQATLALPSIRWVQWLCIGGRVYRCTEASKHDRFVYVRMYVRMYRLLLVYSANTKRYALLASPNIHAVFLLRPKSCQAFRNVTPW
jgi:hypothetical protein